MFFCLLMLLIIYIFVIQGIAFVTLFERHLLGGSQARLGPNKVSFLGLAQAIFDGVKLIKKETILGLNFSGLMFFFVPSMSFVFMLLYWMVLPYCYVFFTFDFSIVFMMCLIGVFVYCVLLSGVMSKSKYGLLGGLRASSQSVSYEIVFSIFLLCFIFFISSFNFIGFYFNFFFIVFVFFYLFLILSELNRAPFDFSEGESELVSGFNVEYSSVPFVLLFLSEYGSLLFFSVLFSIIFFSFNIFFIYFFFSVLIFVRSSFPRFRYDKMMSLFWFNLLPIVLYFLFFMVIFWL